MAYIIDGSGTHFPLPLVGESINLKIFGIFFRYDFLSPYIDLILNPYFQSPPERLYALFL